MFLKQWDLPCNGRNWGILLKAIIKLLSSTCFSFILSYSELMRLYISTPYTMACQVWIQNSIYDMKIANDIFKCIFFHWSLFLRVQLIISQCGFRKWLGVEQTRSHYLKQCWPSSPIPSLGFRPFCSVCFTLTQDYCHPHQSNFTEYKQDMVTKVIPCTCQWVN